MLDDSSSAQNMDGEGVRTKNNEQVEQNRG